MLLESWLALFILAEMLEELLQRLGERFVLGILIKLLSDEFDLVDNAVGMGAVAFTQQVAALVVELLPLLIGSVLQNEALFSEAFSNININQR